MVNDEVLGILTGFVEKSPLFCYIEESDAHELVKYLEYKKLPRGTVIFREGDRGDCVIFIVKGVVEISTKTSFGESLTLAQLGWGTSVGEMAILDELPRSATARVIEDAEFFALSNDDFRKMLGENPLLGVKILMGISWTLSLRLRRNSRRLVDRVLQ